MADGKLQVQRDTPFDLDTPMDQIEELPGFGPWPTGIYGCVFHMEVKDVKRGGEEASAFEVSFTHRETKELGEKASLELSTPNPGDSVSVLYFRDNNVALSNIKKEIFAAIASKFGTQTPRQHMEKANGANCLVVLAREPSKDGTKSYMRVKTLAFV